jgi:hypothetical protein
MTTDIGRELQALKNRIARVERSARLSHAAIDDTAVVVRDGNGGLKGIIGVQADGTTAVNVVNGTAPPAPSTPTAAPALGGIAVGWDGTFADGAQIPLDWSRVEVHASASDGFTPTAETLVSTIETAQGGIIYTPASGPTYVKLLARNTSGTASPATSQVGPYSPTPVAGEIGIGEITETMISDGSVTTPKLYANAVTTPKLAAGSVDAVALKADAITGKTITGGTVTGALIQTAATGDRITLNESSANKVLVYDGSIVSAIAELSKRGLLVQGTNGAVLWLDPNNTYPNLRLTNAAQTNSAVINVSETVTGAADLGLNSGTFSGSGFTDMKWRTFMGGDFWVAERIRNSASTTNIGGRLFLANDHATVAYQDTTTPANNHSLLVYSGYAQFNGGRLEVLAPASANPALKVNPSSGHTGNLAQLQVAGTDKLTVDKDGNVTATGTVTAASSSTTSGLTAGSGFTTNNFYAYRFGKMVALDLYMHRSGTTITATNGNIGDTQIATVPAGWRPTHSTINGAWDDGSSSGAWVIGTDGICTLRTSSSDIVGDATSAGNGRNLRLHITFIQD